MLDIALIRKDPEGIRQRLLTRGQGAADGLAKVLEADQESVGNRKEGKAPVLF